MKKVIGVRLEEDKNKKTYWFNVKFYVNPTFFCSGEYVLVDTCNGEKIGRVVADFRDATPDGIIPTRSVICFLDKKYIVHYLKNKELGNLNQELDQKLKYTWKKVLNDKYENVTAHDKLNALRYVAKSSENTGLIMTIKEIADIQSRIDELEQQ